MAAPSKQQQKENMKTYREIRDHLLAALNILHDRQDLIVGEDDFDTLEAIFNTYSNEYTYLEAKEKVENENGEQVQ